MKYQLVRGEKGLGGAWAIIFKSHRRPCFLGRGFFRISEFSLWSEFSARRICPEKRILVCGCFFGLEVFKNGVPKSEFLRVLSYSGYVAVPKPGILCVVGIGGSSQFSR